VALDRVRWKGEESFRILSYYFSIRWNFEEAGDRVRYALGDFAVRTDPDEEPEIYAPGVPPQYSIVRARAAGNRYHLLYGDGLMVSADVLGALLNPLFLHINAQTLRQSNDFLLIHAGSVSTPQGEGVLLPARAGGGKTTLVIALVRSGFLYLSDEGGAVDPVTRLLYPYPRPLLLKAGHVEVFPELCGEVYGPEWYQAFRWIHPSDIRPGAVASGPCPIRFIVSYEYRPGAATELSPLTPAQGAMELLTNALNLPRYRARALPLVADVVEGAGRYRLVSGDLDEAVQVLTELTSGRQRTPDPAPAR
jgi:hypothetical protein